jgi:hypothetical protein
LPVAVGSRSIERDGASGTLAGSFAGQFTGGDAFGLMLRAAVSAGGVDGMSPLVGSAGAIMRRHAVGGAEVCVCLDSLWPAFETVECRYQH